MKIKTKRWKYRIKYIGGKWAWHPKGVESQVRQYGWWLVTSTRRYNKLKGRHAP